MTGNLDQILFGLAALCGVVAAGGWWSVWRSETATDPAVKFNHNRTLSLTHLATAGALLFASVGYFVGRFVGAI